MTLKRFIVPCFIVCEAPNIEVADEMASKYQTRHSGSYLLLDEGIPTVEVPKDDNIEYHSILETHWNYTTIGKCPTLLTVEDIHKGVTQCAEPLTMEEIGQLCGGN